MNKVILEELDNMKYLFGYKPGRVISEQAAPAPAAPATVEDAIKKIQTILNTKYGAKLNVDGKWGNLTQTALEQAMTKIKSGTTPTAPSSQTTAPVALVSPTASADSKSPLATAPTAPIVAPTAPTAPTAPAKTPQEYYEQLVSMKLIDPIGGNRIVYRGPVPEQNVQDTIDSYLKTQGYSKTRERNPKDKDKQIVVWKK
jgi:hypothetical protein